MFSAPSKFLRSQHRSFPAVVIPKDRQKVDLSFSSSPSTSLTGTSNQNNRQCKKEEENSRVMKLAQRVDKILSEIGSNNSVEEKTMIHAPSSTITQQEKYIDDAESLLRGGSSSSSSVSAELAWANRILNENKTDQVLNNSAFSSSAPSQKDAMMDFLKMTSSSSTSSVAKKNTSYGKSLLDQLRDGNKTMLTETQQSELVDYLDSLVERKMDTFTFVEEDKTSQRSTSANINADDVIDEKATDDDSATLKQARFLRALLNVQNLLENECNFVPRKEWFVACGTALGFRREKKFIAHDNDIDIGILYSDEIHDKIIKLVAKTSQVNVMADVNNNQNKSTLICFETLGTKIHYGGFQLRLIDAETGVMIDINLYYRSPVISSIENQGSYPDKNNQYALIEPFVCQENVNTNNNNNNDTIKQKDSSYWWFATFYEQAEKRKYGMYRYHFSSEAIEEMLSDENVQISSFTTEDVDQNVSYYQFPCPGHLYLQEYFGKKYMTPIQYTYEEAIAEKRYSNMIDE